MREGERITLRRIFVKKLVRMGGDWNEYML
jgi:hypothetical protein